MAEHGADGWRHTTANATARVGGVIGVAGEVMAVVSRT
jgi:hypothetical protein